MTEFTKRNEPDEEEKAQIVERIAKLAEMEDGTYNPVAFCTAVRLVEAFGLEALDEIEAEGKTWEQLADSAGRVEELLGPRDQQGKQKNLIRR